MIVYLAVMGTNLGGWGREAHALKTIEHEYVLDSFAALADRERLKIDPQPQPKEADHVRSES